MIFFFNGPVTDATLFKRFIESVSDYPWKRAIVYYDNKTDDNIGEFITNSFSHTDCVQREEINKSQEDWTNTYDLLNDGLIWVTGCYDHLFVDKDFSHFDEVAGFRRKAGCDKLASIYLSNWSKVLKKCTIVDLGAWDKVNEDHSAPCFAWMTNKDCDSFQVVTKELYKEWWIYGDYSAATNPEELSAVKKFTRPWKVQVPSRELLRFFEDITEKYDFIDEKIDKATRKERLTRYYFSNLSLSEHCLANPRVDAGFLKRVMKYYGFKRKN